jgi:cytochrome c-type biogenesis protein CcmH
MTPFLLLTLAMALLTVGWLTRPLWQHAAPTPVRTEAGDPPAQVPPSPVTIAALAGLVLAVAGAGYVLIGAPEHLDVGPASVAPARGDAAAPGDEALAQAEVRVTAMVDKLAQQLKARPGDAQGWHTLARSYAALGHHAQAVEAFKTALRLRADEPTWLAEYAFSAASLDPRGVSREPARLIARALQIDADNPKALALAGTLALDRRDYQAAIGHWEHLARIEPADSPIRKQLQFSILQAQQLAGLQAGVVPVSMPAAATEVSGAVAPGQIGGTVRLAPALAARALPDDTVYIFARAADGPRMPLAVLRKQVRDLPLQFKLDDRLAVSPTATLSSATRVIVGARIARAGGAVARDGDLQGQLPPTALGRGDLDLEINEVVRLR